ncbi:MAG TPA: hypothetical protein VMU81_12475 [Acetobacteraceae bacterium]|jgi:hypothetical protein|nr:hypothetical protein [Acetobacteraceae bacterium]
MHQRTTHGLKLDYFAKASASLCFNECSMLWNTAKRHLRGWSADFFTDPYGDLNLMILPPNADDDFGPMLIIYKRHGFYMIDTFRWDEYSNAKTCFTFEETAAAIEAVALSVPPTTVSAAIH